MSSEKRPRGRPVERPMPPRIDAPPEEIMRAFFRLPLDHDWQYDRKAKDKGRKR